MSKEKKVIIVVEAPLRKGDMGLIPLDPKIADFFLGDNNKARIIIEFDNGLRLHRAIQRNKDGFCRIVIGNSSLKEVKKDYGLEEAVKITEDLSEFGMPMPEELAEVLAQDAEGEKAFLKLLPGKRRSFLYYINGAKSIDKRIERSLKLIDNLKQGIISAGNYRA